MFWGIWSLIQAEHSYIDFDFIEWVEAATNWIWLTLKIFAQVRSYSFQGIFCQEGNISGTEDCEIIWDLRSVFKFYEIYVVLDMFVIVYR